MTMVVFDASDQHFEGPLQMHGRKGHMQKYSIVPILLIILLNTRVHSFDCWWFGVNPVGASTFGYVFSGSFNVGNGGTHSASARLLYTQGIGSLIPSVTTKEPSPLSFEAGLLYNWCAPIGERWSMRIGAGLSFVYGTRLGDSLCAYDIYRKTTYYERYTYQTVGIPLTVDLVRRFGNRFGIGVSAFGNINPARSYVGLSLSISLGHLPMKKTGN
jgi:hypothetical protein